MRYLICFILLGSVVLAAPSPRPRLKQEDNDPRVGVYKTKYNGIMETLRLEKDGGFYWDNQSHYSGSSCNWAGSWYYDYVSKSMRMEIRYGEPQKEVPRSAIVQFSVGLKGSFQWSILYTHTEDGVKEYVPPPATLVLKRVEPDCR